MTSLEEAKDALRLQLQQGEAVECPLCTQMAKIYRRTIHSAMAVALIMLFNQEDEWVHFPTLLRDAKQRAGDEGKLVYWGLIEPMPGERDDGSRRTGWWRITDLGRSFVQGHTRVGKYASVYDGRCLGIDQTEQVSIRDCLGTNFNYEELMSA
jgi:hypothetical protein